MSQKADRIRRRILIGVDLLDEEGVRSFFDISDLSGMMSELLWVGVDGKMLFPALQFDHSGRRVLPTIEKILSLAKDRDFSGYRVTNWLYTPHLDFDGTPADAMTIQPDEVVAAFKREATEDFHG